MITLTNTSKEELTALCNLSLLNAHSQREHLIRLTTRGNIEHGKELIANQDRIIQLAGKTLIELSK